MRFYLKVLLLMVGVDFYFDWLVVALLLPLVFKDLCVCIALN